MKKSILFLTIWFVLGGLFAQSAREVGVELRANLTSDNYLQLTWLGQSGSTRYQVYTKGNDNISWDRIADLSGSDTMFVDSTYKKGTRKEYRVARTSSNYTGFDGNGYMVAGFDVPASVNLGRVLVLIEDVYQTTAVELVREYLDQIKNEGYTIDTHYVNKNSSVSVVKDWIYKRWSADKNTYTSVLLLGRIPVPYSGNYRPDGHTDHTGAWPADLYYGAFDIAWSDNSVNNSSASFSRNHNTPGDGKFDLSRYNLTSKTTIEYVNIPVGRVDLSDMPAFGNDTQLIKQYLRKSLAFRTGDRKARLKSLVDDNFGYFGSEAFASGGFRNGSVFSAWDISTGDYRSDMSAGSFLLSYGCGAGTYTSCAGVSTSTDFSRDSLLNPFTLLFGSYFGDWDNTDNFLRAPLASKGWGLASVWAGRPYWMMHPCAHGAPLAEATLITQNTWKIYNAAGFQAGVHVALMGDPTLRMFVVDNVDKLNITANCDASATLHWGRISEIADSVVVEVWDGSSWKHVSNRSSSDTAANFKLGVGDHRLSTRFLKLMSSASGTWWQYGARRIDEVTIDTVPAGVILGARPSAYCADSAYVFTNDGSFDASVKSTWLWDGQETNASKGDSIIIKDLNTSGILKLTRVSAFGCLYEDSVQIQRQKMDWELDNSINSHYCLETPYVFRDVASNDTTIRNYWSFNGNTYERAQGDTIQISSTSLGGAVLRLERKSEYGCRYIDSWSLVFSKPEKPEITELQNAGRIGDTIRLSTSSSASYYKWNEYDPGDIPEFSFVADSEKIMVSLQIIDSMGCNSDTALKEFNFVINANSGFELDGIIAYPNPISDFLWLSLPDGFGDSRLMIMDVKGQFVLNAFLHKGVNKIGTQNLLPGIYILQVTEVNSDRSTTLRIVK